MLLLSRLIGLIIIGLGIVFLINPGSWKKLANFWVQGKNLYMAAVIRILFGIILLISAANCKLGFIVAILGILLVVGGVLIFALGLSKCKSYIKKIAGKPISVLRGLAIIGIVIGLLLLYSI